MKKTAKVTKVQIVNIIMGIISMIYFLVPWLETSDGKCNGMTYLMRVYTHGFAEVFQQTFSNGIGGELSGGIAGGTLFTAQLFYFLMIVSVIVQCAVWVYVLASCLGHQMIKFLSIPTWIYGIVFTFFYFQTMESTSFLADGTELSIPVSVYAYFLLFVALEFIWILLVKMLEEWDAAAKRAKLVRVKKIEDKKERRKRLAFPGKYSKFYYHILWKDILYRKKDFLFLLLAQFLCTIFLFTGGGDLQHAFGRIWGRLWTVGTWIG